MFRKMETPDLRDVIDDVIFIKSKQKYELFRKS